jgi:hypothetical protein
MGDYRCEWHKHVIGTGGQEYRKTLMDVKIEGDKIFEQRAV